jgi:hypothetical protein
MSWQAGKQTQKNPQAYRLTSYIIRTHKKDEALFKPASTAVTAFRESGPFLFACKHDSHYFN